MLSLLAATIRLSSYHLQEGMRNEKDIHTFCIADINSEAVE
jgi:hypothetical protein